ncbi:MAG: pyruvate:ferredoxin (flavodoxin) oxidoreductase [Arenicellales bacterium]|mgnify:FL=1|nr:pyruvate:ferredoxin (flavodoxin) oxidoreductase [Arenicellales bacterium]MDP7156190.1 pyruvate:ferredoxin (flavodoxin) oxidoreductase [Arenicellales bacterium]HJL65266.1 pyruvate:ferredoxin (flavodoxin) oxidoreductase [Arenicellales bacterium]
MSTPRTTIIDGNEAAVWVAYLTNEVIAIYPITPSSTMGELADQWSSEGRTNHWGSVPNITEMQSEGGASGVIHGALQAGSLATTFTSSQGLLLMIPNMYKIAGELTPTVFHVAARTVATHALSIFCDHSDVMAARTTGFGILASGSVQEVMDMALISQAATLEGRIPLIHMFDGFRTSHELNRIVMLESETVEAMIPRSLVQAHRDRSLSPEHPVIRGTSQNPDVFFQAREQVNSYYQRMPEVVQKAMNHFAQLTGRKYRLFDYIGNSDANRIVILMGSGAETVDVTIDQMNAAGEKVGAVKVRLFRPFDSKALFDVLPRSVKQIAVLDRTKEPGAEGEPLYKDIVTALAQNQSNHEFDQQINVVGGRYGLSSKEFTPGMVKSIFDELTKPEPKNDFTVGIYDDVSHKSLDYDRNYRVSVVKGSMSAVFYGLGSDGTVSANKNTIKIIGEETDNYVQGYFEYDSKKAGAVTISHLRFGPDPIRSAHLVETGEAALVACHQPQFLLRYDMLAQAAEGAIFLLNSPAPAEEVWESLPRLYQQAILDKQIELYLIDAYAVARKTGMGARINTIMQACFFAVTGILETNKAIEVIKVAVEKSYGRKGRKLVKRNHKAIDESLHQLHKIDIPESVTSTQEQPPAVSKNAPPFVQEVTGEIIAGRGNEIPVSLFPADGTFPLGTAAYEKRNLALAIPVWDTDLCTHCGKCPLVCPHTAIRSKIFNQSLLVDAPRSFKSVAVKGKDFPQGTMISYQVAPEDCTGCGLCVEVCPIRSKEEPDKKALNMLTQAPLLEDEKESWSFFTTIPESDRSLIKTSTIKGAMLLEPLFEFSGACVGCGETPYIKLATQLFGDRMIIANATGCSSIYGGNLPTTPWTTNDQGRGPAWSNSLFEDNAEFGLGFRLSIDHHALVARQKLSSFKEPLGEEFCDALINADQADESGIWEQRQRVDLLKQTLKKIGTPESGELADLADYLVHRSVWIIGGDGWAYDIGFGGLDHVMASGKNVNILVLDTEVYSNTGGQTSKATPRGAVAKFSAGGKPSGKKDLAMMAMSYENVYVAQIASGAKDVQTVRAFLEAESYAGVSLIIAYSPCIAHGVDLKNALRQQELAVKSGHWPLFRFDPRRSERGENPLTLDSKEPSIAYRDFIDTEARFSFLGRTRPEIAEEHLNKSQSQVIARYRHYQQLSELQVEED